MDSQTCAYVARKDEPEHWHGTDPSEFKLDRGPMVGGFGITEWHCPHPPLGAEEGDEEFCVFHTETEVPADRQLGELLDALEEAGDSPDSDSQEHRGQFVGATFGAIDLSGETIAATDDYDIRFDHTQFQVEDEDLNFDNTTFEIRGQHPISFYRAEFITDGAGDVWFDEATFRAEGDGDVWFDEATFRAEGDGDVRFLEATFRAEGDGLVGFDEATFRAEGDGSVRFPEATFRAEGDGSVLFRDVTLTDVDFRHADFGKVLLGGADLTGSDLRNADVADVSVTGATTCERLYEGYEADTLLGRLWPGSEFDPEGWDATARAYHDLKTVFSGHGLVGKARTMHIKERRARSLEAEAERKWFDYRYAKSLGSRFITGYGVQYKYLVSWMLLLFSYSTLVYVQEGVRDTPVENIAYSVLAFTVAPPPPIPSTLLAQGMMMVETFFGTLSIVLLGYILGNRERF